MALCGVPLSNRKDVKFDYDMRFPSTYQELMSKKEIATNWILPLMWTKE